MNIELSKSELLSVLVSLHNEALTIEERKHDASKVWTLYEKLTAKFDEPLAALYE